VKLYAGVRNKTLANHPTKWDSGQAVPRTVLDGPPTDVYTMMSGPSALLRGSKFTAVTPGKPNFQCVCPGVVVVVVAFVFLLAQ